MLVVDFNLCRLSGNMQSTDAARQHWVSQGLSSTGASTMVALDGEKRAIHLVGMLSCQEHAGLTARPPAIGVKIVVAAAETR